jgi:hypothetical protein
MCSVLLRFVAKVRHLWCISQMVGSRTSDSLKKPRIASDSGLLQTKFSHQPGPLAATGWCDFSSRGLRVSAWQNLSAPVRPAGGRDPAQPIAAHLYMLSRRCEALVGRQMRKSLFPQAKWGCLFRSIGIDMATRCFFM